MSSPSDVNKIERSLLVATSHNLANPLQVRLPKWKIHMSFFVTYLALTTEIDQISSSRELTLLRLLVHGCVYIKDWHFFSFKDGVTIVRPSLSKSSRSNVNIPSSAGTCNDVAQPCPRSKVTHFSCLKLFFLENVFKMGLYSYTIYGSLRRSGN